MLPRFSTRSRALSLLFLLAALVVYIYALARLFTTPPPEAVPFLVGAFATPLAATRLRPLPAMVVIGLLSIGAQLLASRSFSESLHTGFCAFFVVGMPILIGHAFWRAGRDTGDGLEQAAAPRGQVVVGLSGYTGSGKRAAAAGLLEDGWVKAAVMDKVREFAAVWNPMVPVPNVYYPEYVEHLPLAELVARVGWDQAQENPDVAGLLARLEAEGRSMVGEAVWVDMLLRDLRGENVVVTDIWRRAEAEAIRAAGGYIVRVERPGVLPLEDHVAQTELDGYDFDVVVRNDSTPDALASRVRKSVGRLRYGSPQAS